jgi:hypothetical protein
MTMETNFVAFVFISFDNGILLFSLLFVGVILI